MKLHSLWPDKNELQSKYYLARSHSSFFDCLACLDCWLLTAKYHLRCSVCHYVCVSLCVLCSNCASNCAFSSVRYVLLLYRIRCSASNITWMLTAKLLLFLLQLSRASKTWFPHRRNPSPPQSFSVSASLHLLVSLVFKNAMK